LVMALRVSSDKIESKGIKSIRSRVTNIYPYLKKPYTIVDFKNLLLDQFRLKNGKIESIYFNDNDRKQIEKLVRTKYQTWEWNYGESPFFTIKKTQRFDFGKVEAWLDINEGIIKKCKFYGDFFGRDDKEDIEEKLIGCRYERNEITLRMNDIGIENYFYGLNKDQFINLLVS